MPQVLVRLNDTPSCDEDCGDGFREILLIDQKAWNATIEALRQYEKKTGNDSFEHDYSCGAHGCILVFPHSLFYDANVQRVTAKEKTLLSKFVSIYDHEDCEWYQDLVSRLK